MIKILQTLLLLLTVVTCCFSQSSKGTVKGQVIAADSTPAAFVPIGIKGTTIGTTTDGEGNYKFKVPEGKQTLLIQFVGHEPEEKEIEVIAGQTVSSDFVLKESTNELKEVIITGTSNKYKEENPSSSLRLAAPLIEIPQNIQVVTGGMLKDQQVISMSDGLIRNVSGLVRLEHWGDLYTNINARGSQIGAFRNGFNVVNSYWGPLTEDVSFVDRIEFVKGPAGFMLANGDPSGLYNVVTKKPTGKPMRQVELTYGSYDLYRGSFDWDGKLSKNGKLLFRLNLAGQKKKSHRAYEFNDRYTVAPVLSYQLSRKTKLTAEYTYQRANMSNLGSFYVFSPFGFASLPVDFTTLSPSLPPSYINEHHFTFNAHHQLTARWKITAQVSRLDYYQNGSSMWPGYVDTLTGAMIRGVSSWEAKSLLDLGQLFVNGESMTGSIRHRVLAGIDAGNKKYWADWGQYHELDSPEAPFDPRNPNYGTPTTGLPKFDFSKPIEQRAKGVGGTQTQGYSSLYVQDELGFFDSKVRLTLAGRYTYVKQSYSDTASASHFTPRIGLSISLSKLTSFYALYDQAFIPQTGVVVRGGPIKPITGNNMEVGVKRDWMGGRWSTTVAVYRIIKNNELATDPLYSTAGNPIKMPLGQKTSQGIEFDLTGTIAKGLNVTANYALTDSKVTKVNEGVNDVKVGELVPSYAKHTANAWLSYQFAKGLVKGFGFSLGFTYLSGRITYWSLSPDNTPLDNYFKFDGGLSWENSKIKITANMYNILNEYLYSGSWYGGLNSYNWQTEAPRNGRVSISYKF